MAVPRFGGSWTQQKLDVVQRYLDRYTSALKGQAFRRIYIDAFAGTGARRPKRLETQLQLDLPELDAITKGSARLALEIEPPFDEYVLIEKSAQRASELSSLVREYPNRRTRIVNQDANEAIAQVCASTGWRTTRAVAFLDPYGLQVSWEALTSISRTCAIDVWLLVPTGIGLRRLLKRDGNIPQDWQDVLDRFLGTPDWRSEFYKTEEVNDLFGDAVAANVRDARTEKLEEFVLDRLRSIFPVVMERGVSLTNSKNQAMYLLCFASANPSPKVKTLALRLASWAAKA